jgi:DNA-binding winged helix-turn-helix (wHTH) protein/TolB-like protein
MRKCIILRQGGLQVSRLGEGIRRFGPFELDLGLGVLSRDGIPLKIQPQPLKVLAALTEQPGQVVTRDALRTRIWDEATFVEFDQGLNYCVRQIRIALGDDAAEPAYIETLPKQGYRFVAPVETDGGPADAAKIPPETAPPNRRWLVMALALCATALSAAGLWIWNRVQLRKEPPSVVVLPLVNKTGDPSLDYLVDGTTSEIIRRLALLPGLKVIGKASSMSLKGQAIDPRELSRRWGVRTVLSGSVGRDERDLTIDLEVSDGRDGTIILNRLYRQFGANPQALQAAIIEDVAQNLDVRLRPGEPLALERPKTKDPQAWDLYLRAGHAMDHTDFPEAERLLTAAVDKDPRFALAYSSLASVHTFEGLYMDDPRRHLPEAKRLATRALALDESLRDPHGILGLVALTHEWDYPEAERRLILAGGRIHPAATTSLACTAHLMASAGRLSGRAEDEIKLSLANNPMSVALMSELGCTAYYARQYSRAIDGYNRALALKPDDLIGLWGLGKTYVQLGRYQDALAALSRAPKPMGVYSPVILGEIGYVYARKGDKNAARQCIRQLRDLGGKAFVDPYFRAEIHEALGETDAALAALEEAYETRSAILVAIKSDPKWDGLQRNPRFGALLRRIGF